MYGSFGVGGDEIVFCSTVDWWTCEYAFVTVPLDGGVKREGLPEADPGESDGDTVSIGGMRSIPPDIEELELWGHGLEDEDIKLLAKLKELRKLYLLITT